MVEWEEFQISNGILKQKVDDIRLYAYIRLYACAGNWNVTKHKIQRSHDFNCWRCFEKNKMNGRTRTNARSFCNMLAPLNTTHYCRNFKGLFNKIFKNPRPRVSFWTIVAKDVENRIAIPKTARAKARGQ